MMADPTERERLAEEVGKLLDVPDLKIKDCFKVASLIIAERDKARAEALAEAAGTATPASGYDYTKHDEPYFRGWREGQESFRRHMRDMSTTHTEGRDE